MAGSWMCPGCGVVVPDDVTWGPGESPCDCPPGRVRMGVIAPVGVDPCDDCARLRDELARYRAFVRQFDAFDQMVGSYAEMYGLWLSLREARATLPDDVADGEGDA